MNNMRVIGILGVLIAAACVANAAPVVAQGDWEVTLQGRDLDGNSANGYEAFYDTALNLTWLADANYANTLGFNPPANSTPNAVTEPGYMSWVSAQSFVQGLSVHGITGWRLPAMTNGAYESSNGFNVDTNLSELAHMFYVTLGNKAPIDATGQAQTPSGLINTALFRNLLPNWYFTGNGAGPGSGDFAVDFNMGSGYQVAQLSSLSPAYVWAVRSGDVAAIPEPQSWGMALVGLIVAAGFAWRKVRCASW